MLALLLRVVLSYKTLVGFGLLYICLVGRVGCLRTCVIAFVGFRVYLFCLCLVLGWFVVVYGCLVDWFGWLLSFLLVV